MNRQKTAGTAAVVTLLDHFAGLAMAALVTASGDSEGRYDYDTEKIAAMAYDLAGAMIEVRGEVET